MTETLTISAAPPPDWSIIDEEIRCPLCDYNLRGLAEPRCPECGYRFEWPDLLDPTRRKHPFVFEHHPERNVWSFFRTLRAGLRPTRFWRSLHPAQPASLNRLVKYVAIVAAFVVAANLADVIHTAVTLSNINKQTRLQIRAAVQNSTAQQSFLAYIASDFDSIDDAVETLAPSGWSFEFVRGLVRELAKQDPVVVVSGIYLSWPLLALAALLIFRWSMRTAKVRAIHVFRCIAYSFDATVWVAIAFLSIAAAWAAWGSSFNLRRDLFNLQLLFIVSALMVMTYRLYVGYKVYLQFNRPLATAVASQVIVGLAMLKLVCLTLLGA